MKKIMEMLQNMKAKNEKKDNKGFSLVELIIVIAIMAILVGIVGTQVLPYINKSKEAKDFQIINSFGTAATPAYSSNAEKTTTLTKVDVYGSGSSGTSAADLEEEIKTLTGYADIGKLTAKMGSTKGQSITHVLIVINPTTTNDIGTGGTGAKAKTIVTQAYDKDGKKVFDEVVTQL